MININNITFSYAKDEKAAIKNIELQIHEGEFVLLLGASGCGKTTITRLINGLIPEFYSGELAGEVLIEGKNTSDVYVSELSSIVGSVFQDPHSQFFTTDTTSEIAFSCENSGLERDDMITRVENVTNELDISHLLQRSIFKLSGGEKQSVAIASVCAYSPKIIVLDEPSANLDGYAIEKLRIMLEKLQAKGYTIIISEHRIHYLKELCNRVLYMKNGEIIQEFTKDEFNQLGNEKVHSMGLRALDLKSIHVQSHTIPSGEDLLKLFDITYYYNKKNSVITNLNFSASKGQIIGVVGKNGAGKSTFMELICGLLREKNGSVHIKNKIANIKYRNKDTYLVMQTSDYQLFTESVETELYLGAESDENLDKKGKELIEKLNLSDYLQRHPASLSGGQKQRLCIAVAYMKEADIVCFDEPTSGLDYNSMKSVSKIIREMSASGKSIIVVTHDYEFLLKCCTHAMYMKNHKTNDFFPITDKTKNKLFDIITGEE